MALIYIKFYFKVALIVMFALLLYSAPTLIAYWVTGSTPWEMIIASIIAPCIVFPIILLALINRNKNKVIE